MARAVVAAWIGALRRTIETEGFARRFAVPLTALEIVVSELIILARRADIEGGIAADLKDLATIERSEQSTVKLALIAATRLNRLTGSLGFNLVPPAGDLIHELAGRKWFGDVKIGSQRKTLFHLRVAPFRGQHDDLDVAQVNVLAQSRTYSQFGRRPKVY